jgi:hypothetical protein
MKNLFVLMLMVAMSSVYAKKSTNEKLSQVNELIDTVLDARAGYPTTGDDSAAMRFSIDSANFGASKSFHYCKHGMWKIGRSGNLEIPFRIGRKKACSKSIPGVIERMKQVNEEYYRPLLASSEKIRSISLELLEDKALNNCSIGLQMALIRVKTRVRVPVVVTDHRGDRISINTAVTRLARFIERAEELTYEERSEQKDFLNAYKIFSEPIGPYAQNFRTELVLESLQSLQDEIVSAQSSGCLSGIK